MNMHRFSTHFSTTEAGADWATWHLPGGPVGRASRWAAISNVGIGQTTYHVNRGRVGWERREQWTVTKKRKGVVCETREGQGPLDREGCTLIFEGGSRLPSFTTADEAGILT